MNSYLAYGLGIQSSLLLPELMAQPAPPDIVIRRGRLDRPLPEVGSQPVQVHATPTEALYWSERVGWMLIRNGKEIVVEPLEGVDERTLRLFVLGPALGILLHQRGHLVLHGSAVSLDGAAAAFVGPPGQGKSTLAAALHVRGHSVVADDVADVRLEGDVPELLPGFPQLKLSAESATAVGPEVDTEPLNHPHEKRYLRAADRFSQAPLPLRRIYVLDDGDVNEIQPLPPQQAMIELVRHTYVILLIGPTNASAAHFRQCSAIANQVPVRRLIRQRSFSVLPEVARLVEQDVLCPS